MLVIDRVEKPSTDKNGFVDTVKRGSTLVIERIVSRPCETTSKIGKWSRIYDRPAPGVMLCGGDKA